MAFTDALENAAESTGRIDRMQRATRAAQRGNLVSRMFVWERPNEGMYAVPCGFIYRIS